MEEYLLEKKPKEIGLLPPVDPRNPGLGAGGGISVGDPLLEALYATADKRKERKVGRYKRIEDPTLQAD